MFSSIASFLPSALHMNSSGSNAVLNPTDSPIEEEAYRQHVEDDINIKKNSDSSKPKNANETFIFVRPPPAKNNHPLNLQVQLVPPTSRMPRQSLDEPDTPVTLTRTVSNRSDTSSYGSTASFSSTVSSGSGRRTIIPLYSLQAHNVLTNTIVDAGTDAKIAKFQRRGIELIDLAFLEPVEVWGERPRAMRPATPDIATTTAGSSTVSLSSNTHSQQAHQPPVLQAPPTSTAPLKRNLFGKLFKKPGKDSTPPSSPAASSFSINTTPTQRMPDPMERSAVTPTLHRPTSRTHIRNISGALSPTAFTGMLGGRNRSPSPNPALVGLGPTTSNDETTTNGSNTSSTDLPNPGSEEKILRPPVLGIQPTLSFSYVPNPNIPQPAPLSATSLTKNARALMYVWFVRKWIKRRARLSARGPGSMMGVGGTTTDDVEVRFEWKRTSAGKKSKRDKNRESERRGRGSFVASEEGGDKDRDALREKEKQRREQSEKRMSNRLSVISHQSVSTNVSISEDGHSPSWRERARGNTPQPAVRKGSRSGTPTRETHRERQGSLTQTPQKGGDKERDDDIFDAGEESDPEDSETPWVCTLKIRRTGTSTSPPGSMRTDRGQASGLQNRNEYGEVGPEGGSALSRPQVLRIKVGTLSPTPHHPKIVGMLKVPFPLPDIEVERMGVHRRPVGQPGARPSISHHWDGTTLTAEEIKDVVCSTGLWLVVREGFGGVGKVNRKGDGWRIRA